MLATLAALLASVLTVNGSPTGSAKAPAAHRAGPVASMDATRSLRAARITKRPRPSASLEMPKLYVRDLDRKGCPAPGRDGVRHCRESVPVAKRGAGNRLARASKTVVDAYSG